LEIETGEYFLKQDQKDAIKRKEKREKQTEKTKEREIDRQKIFQPPEEPKLETVSQKNTNDFDVQAAVTNIKKTSKRKKSDGPGDLEDYIITKKRKQ